MKKKARRYYMDLKATDNFYDTQLVGERHIREVFAHFFPNRNIETVVNDLNRGRLVETPAAYYHRQRIPATGAKQEKGLTQA